MPKIQYTTYRPQATAELIILEANQILNKYAMEGYSLTLRQLYYQFVAKDLFPDSWINKEGTKNNQANYSKLGSIISKAREAGFLDWCSMVDRGRRAVQSPHWMDPSDFMKSVLPQFAIDKWENQPKRIEVWVEKEALIDVVAKACVPFDVPYLACKGYMSASAIWKAGHDRILQAWNDRAQETIILHLGDHDPSGLDMTRDIDARLRKFTRQYEPSETGNPCCLFVDRIALTMSQIEDFNPPPNPAKETDSRCKAYRDEYGDESWELDALDPSYLVDLITENIEHYMHEDLFKEKENQEKAWRDSLAAACKNINVG